MEINDTRPAPTPAAPATTHENDFQRVQREHRERVAAVHAALAGREFGTELRDHYGHYAVLLREMNGDANPFRVTRYCATGFTGHTPYRSLEAAIKELAEDGYVTADPGALRRFSTTKEWAIGMAQINYVGKWNGAGWDAKCGRLSSKEVADVRERAKRELEADLACIEVEWAGRTGAVAS